MRLSLRTLFIALLIFFIIMGGVFVFVAAQVFQHSLISVASAEISEDVIRQATISVVFQQGFIILAMLVLVGGGFFFAVHAYVIAPLGKLHASLQEVGKQQFDIRLPQGPNNEIGDLFEAFNEMTDRLEEGKDRDEGVSRMKSEFLSIAAHQLRTPLSALKWVLRMTLEGDVGKVTKKQQDLLQKGYDSNERMIALVNDLLDVVRIEEGRFDYRFQKVELVAFFEEIIDDMQIIADQKKVLLIFNKPSYSIPAIAVDSEKLRLAFMNIVDNGLQYTHAKGRVEVEITYEKNKILINVKDTGIGVSKAQLTRLFSKFFRADNAVRMQTSGSGLGLFIAKNIIEKHGGKIWIESEEGKGTIASFTLPVSHFKK